MTSKVLVLASAMVLVAGASFAQQLGFGDLGNTAQGARVAMSAADLKPGENVPVIELKGDGKFWRTGCEIVLTQNGQSKSLGFLSKHAFGFRYQLTDVMPAKGVKPVVKVSLETAGKFIKNDFTYELFIGDKVTRVGKLHDKLVTGTGIEVSNPGEKYFGYIDEKTWQAVLQSFRTWGIDCKTAYSFNTVTYKTGRSMFGKEKLVRDTVTPKFYFVDKDFMNWGASGVFVDLTGKPILFLKGRWWDSDAPIFDFTTTNREAGGKVGKALGTAGKIISILNDDPQAAKDIEDMENQLVPNPTAYIGVFLGGMVFFPEFRKAAGLDVDLPVIE